MKVLQDARQSPPYQNAVADLAARIAVIFEQYPTLCGFSVQERSTLTTDRAIARLQGNLYLADVSVSDWPGFRVPREVYDPIASLLLDLMDEHPEAFDLLAGRTFARTLH